MDSTQRKCPLCLASEVTFFHRQTPKEGARSFLKCVGCDLIFADASHRLPADEEIKRYQTHENDPAQEGYRNFLMTFFSPLRERLKLGAHGLDFGSGPGPVPALATLLEKEGFKMKIYDKYFHPESSALNDKYDFVTCTETVEHFHEPGQEFKTLSSLIKPGGWLGIRTQRLDPQESFATWYYHRDPTHVAFYSEKTMRWIANHLGWKCYFPSPHTSLFQA